MTVTQPSNRTGRETADGNQIWVGFPAPIWDAGSLEKFLFFFHNLPGVPAKIYCIFTIFSHRSSQKHNSHARCELCELVWENIVKIHKDDNRRIRI